MWLVSPLRTDPCAVGVGRPSLWVWHRSSSWLSCSRFRGPAGALKQGSYSGSGLDSKLVAGFEAHSSMSLHLLFSPLQPPGPQPVRHALAGPLSPSARSSVITAAASLLFPLPLQATLTVDLSNRFHGVGEGGLLRGGRRGSTGGLVHWSRKAEITHALIQSFN